MVKNVMVMKVIGKECKRQWLNGKKCIGKKCKW